MQASGSSRQDQELHSAATSDEDALLAGPSLASLASGLWGSRLHRPLPTTQPQNPGESGSTSSRSRNRSRHCRRNDSDDDDKHDHHDHAEAASDMLCGLMKAVVDNCNAWHLLGYRGWASNRENTWDCALPHNREVLTPAYYMMYHLVYRPSVVEALIHESQQQSHPSHKSRAEEPHKLIEEQFLELTDPVKPQSDIRAPNRSWVGTSFVAAPQPAERAHRPRPAAQCCLQA